MPATHADRFRTYLDCFNAGDFEALRREFYAEDVELVNGAGVAMRGPDEVFDFYRRLRTTAQRTIVPLRVLANDDVVIAELESEFLALVDAPDFVSGPMREGDRLYINSVAIYEMRDGRYSRIRAATLRREWRRRAEAPIA